MLAVGQTVGGLSKHISKPVPDRDQAYQVNPGEPLWWKTDNRLRGLTRAVETATTFELPTLTNPADDANQEDRGYFINKTLTEMQEQLKALEEEAPRAAEAKMSAHGQKAKDTD